MTEQHLAAQLHKSLSEATDLRCVPQLDGQLLFWKLYKDASVFVQCSDDTAHIEIVNDRLVQDTVIQWTLPKDQALRQLLALGKRGHMLVIKKTIHATEVFYLGPPDQFPLQQQQPFFASRKKWDSGSLIYLEQV